MTWRLPDTYHSAGTRRGTAILKFYEGRDILWRHVRYDNLSPAVAKVLRGRNRAETARWLAFRWAAVRWAARLSTPMIWWCPG